MTPAFCRVGHAPEEGKYGDCLRACVATILDLNTEDVPHVFEDDCTAEVGNQRLRDWLKTHQLAPFWIGFEAGGATATDIMEAVAINNPDVPFILYGETAYGGQHVVVCQGGKKVHDPAWIATPFVGPGATGAWMVLVIAKL